MKNRSQACVDTVARINLQPEEEVVRLLIGPNDFNDDAGESDLRDNNTVPDFVE